MPTDWYSIDDLRRAWRYARIDMRDDFVFDVIDHQDAVHNIDVVLRALHSQLQQGQYRPAPILSVPVPKSDHSYRPGTTVLPVDLIVLYAIAQQLAPPLDRLLSDCAYAYRLNPRREERRQPLFTDRESPEHEEDESDEDQVELAVEIGFPYNWFLNWIRFHVATESAAEEFEYVAVADIVAYFEKISFRILFDQMGRLLGEQYRELLHGLRFLLDYWDWVVLDDNVPGTGLPQGNAVSAFLSNVYLNDLDRAMLTSVEGDVHKYLRYVDDIRLYTSSYNEACQALVELERVLRTLGLNVQTAKTEIKLAAELSDPEVVEWMQRLEREAEEPLESARHFITQVLDSSDPESVAKWQRVYRRSLTVLGDAMDDVAVFVALEMLLEDPSDAMLRKNFKYLRRFVQTHCFEDDIHGCLSQGGFMFDYHRAYLYRLAAYSRGEHSGLREVALGEASDATAHWFSRVGALLFLSTCRLSSSELGMISRAAVNEGNPQVLRSMYVALCQHSGDELTQVLNNVAYFSAPHQDYFRRYLFRLVRRDSDGDGVLTAVNRVNLGSPFFIRHLHQLDLVKANQSLRSRFRGVLEEKIESCSRGWPRLRSRLQGIYDAFVEHP